MLKNPAFLCVTLMSLVIVLVVRQVTTAQKLKAPPPPQVAKTTIRYEIDFSKPPNQRVSVPTEYIPDHTRRFVYTNNGVGQIGQLLLQTPVKTHPTLLGFLRDESIYEATVKPFSESDPADSPFHRICLLLKSSPPEESVELLIRFFEDSSVHIRKDAAFVIGASGKESILPILQKAFVDDELICEAAIDGLFSALLRDALDSKVTGEVYTDVFALVKEKRGGENAPLVLYLLNPKEGGEYLASELVQMTDSAEVSKMLKKLRRIEATIPREPILSLISSLEERDLSDSNADALANALILLGQQRNDADKKFLRVRTEHPDERVALGALNGLIAWNDLANLMDHLLAESRAVGFFRLSEPKRYCVAVYILNKHVMHDGFGYYFGTDDGNTWKDALVRAKSNGLARAYRSF